MRPRRLYALYGLLLLMEVIAGFTVVVGTGLLDLMGTPYSTFWVFLLGGWLGTVVGLAVGALRPKEPWSRILFLGAGVAVAALLALPVSNGIVSIVLVAILIGVAFWRGLAVTTEPPDYSEVQRRFGYGFFILFLGIVWVVARGALTHRSILQLIAALGIGYVLAAMTALVTARVAPSREPGAAPAIVLAVGLELAIVLGLSVTALELLSVDIASWLAHLTQPFWNAAGPLLTSAINLLLLPIQWVVDFVRATANPHHATHINTPQIGHTGGHKIKHHRTSNQWALYLAIGVAALLVAGIAYLIWRTIPRIPRDPGPRGFREERRALSLDEMVAALLAWLRRVLGLAAKGAASAAHAARTRVLGPTYPSDPVRRLYAQMLHRAGTAGVRRSAGATPLEFAGTLSSRWPQGKSDFDALTDAYIMRRYGGLEFESGEVERLRDTWHRVRLLLRRPRKSIRQIVSEQLVQ